jgi:hypothetical protein
MVDKVGDCTAAVNEVLKEFNAVEESVEDLWLDEDRSWAASRQHDNGAFIELIQVAREIRSKFCNGRCLEHIAPPNLQPGNRLPPQCTY